MIGPWTGERSVGSQLVDAFYGFGRRLVPEGLPPRLTLIFLLISAQALADGMTWIFEQVARPFFVISVMLIRIGIYAALLVALHPAVDRVLAPYGPRLARVSWLAAVVMVLFTVSQGLAFVRAFGSPSYYSNDAIALNHHAIDLLLQGENPYTASSIVATLDGYRLMSTSTTPLRQGSLANAVPYPTSGQLDWALNLARARGDAIPAEFESRTSYPAGSFLLPAPLIALGLPELRLFYLLCGVVLSVIIYRLVAPALRPFTSLVLVGNAGLWTNIVGGTIDTLYLPFLLLGWLSWRRPWLAGLLFGVAASCKQITWFYLLFLAVLMFRQRGVRATTLCFSVVGAVFLAINGPFIIADYHGWLAGILAPMADPMFPMGAGLIALATVGLLPAGSSLPYTVLEAVAMAAALVWFWRSCRQAPEAGLLLATAPLFVAWRSLPSYFFPVPFLLFGAVLTERYRGIEAVVERVELAAPATQRQRLQRDASGG